MPMMPNGPAAMQGLQSARPDDQEAPSQEGGGPEELLQAAGSILEQAVSQFGPEIILVLKEMLSGSAPSGAGEEAGGGMMGGGGGMM